MTANRPYLLRAFYEWIVDNSCTPYLVVDATANGVKVPTQFIQNGQIVLNVLPSAVGNLQLGNDAITFNARFGGQPFALFIPVSAVLAIYARENGAGTVFTLEEEEDEAEFFNSELAEDSDLPEPPKPKKASHLKVVK
ncbi:ClpXP protease specificity-enhancing factor [Rheinheimera baltica]|uniref:ClpXP protease specificity-enhancing factor n=1 Tax=Rheinheimera baltica TaxID=67576 RepID=A0ABT9HZW2_9GAMM|nr:ClpXP protease specificity-enhancing factor [Rheinheimera baltica]MDP5136669.1 ClpXP protease specificity-enhancing factor [Rheinheimera baltica]MDP5142503.1 ClpXP protease specificity-enhancing factor [Rheinheimera baltica]MDP5150376.1 ClpXP protease specificity-enhancing factor [Rheinheimera baltica]MDP5188647.1 ClpXP protease specificity-enhancing factor [Rheinheimera baltica]